MKSKEDCLSQATGIGIEDLRFKNEVEIVRPSEVYVAMDEWAKQEAIKQYTELYEAIKQYTELYDYWVKYIRNASEELKAKR